jgi:hypothetical protein
MLSTAFLLAASMVVVGQAEETTSNYEHLKVLQPFLGSWTYEGVLHDDIPGLAIKGVNVRIPFRYRWILNRNALMMDWSVQVDSGADLDGKVLIGFDPKGNKIVSGEFTSSGRYSHGEWSVEGNTLTITGRGVAADGSEIANVVTNTITDSGTMIWQAKDQTRGGERVPDSAEYEFKRPAQEDVTGSNYEHLKFFDFYRGRWRLEGMLPEGKYVGEESNAWTFKKNIQRTAGWGRIGDGERVDYEILVGWDPAKEKVFMWIAGSDGSSSVREGTYDPQKRCLTSQQRSVDSTGVETTATVEEQRIDRNTFVIKMTEVVKGGERQPDVEITATRIAP